MPEFSIDDPAHVVDRVDELLSIYDSLNASVATLLCDQYLPESTAFSVVEPDGGVSVISYGELRRSSERFAASLQELGVKPGDRVATLMGKSAHYLASMLGIWRLGAVHVPLFTAFAPPAIAYRLELSGSSIVICDRDQRWKLTGDDYSSILAFRVIVDENDTEQNNAETDDIGWGELVAQFESGFPAASLGGDAPMIHIFTSGTTGQPKGVVVPIRALAAFRFYVEYGLGVRPDDVYWCAADPGWAYGLYFAVVGSLCLGVPSVLLHSGFSPETTWSTMANLRVTNFAAAPTVYRALRASEATVPNNLKLRCASSAGEPLTPDVNEWAQETLGFAIHDHYGQTEAGMLINNHQHPALEKPLVRGSMGHVMPGWSIAVLDESDEIALTNEVGRIAVATSSRFAWFRGYEGEPEKNAEKFTPDGRWYLTGDVGSCDDDGYFHFSARDDDVIIMAGYRIGPFEVESVLASHPAISECAVIAVPDEVRGEIMEAYVVLRDPDTGTPELTDELKRLVKSKYAAHAYPRKIHFVSELPKTPSGKVQRFALRQIREDELNAK